MVADKANFSISTDDPTLTGTTLTDEYNLVIDKYGLTPRDIKIAVSFDHKLFDVKILLDFSRYLIAEFERSQISFLAGR